MRILVQNTLFDERQEYDLEKGSYILGRLGQNSANESQPDIVIASRCSSDRQAELVVEDTSWSIQHIGLNPTYVDDKPIQFGTLTRLEDNAKIRIGEYLVHKTNDDLYDSMEVEGEDYLKASVDIEILIHDQLLESLDLRRSTEVIDTNNKEIRKRIKVNLDRLVENQIQDIGTELNDYLIRHAIYRRLNENITTTGDDKTNSSYTEYENIYNESLITDVLLKLHTEMSLELSTKSMRADSDKLDAGFVEAYRKHEIGFSEGVKSYIVSMFFKRNILDLIFGYGPLQELLDTQSISEIMVISKDKIFVEKFGVVEDSRRRFHDDAALMSVIAKIVDPVNRKVDASTPYVDARLPDGSRVNAIIPPLAVKGPALTIRKFATVPITIEKLVEFEALDEPMKNFLGACVENHMNVIVSGGTGSGKTTMLNCLSSYISDSERTITIEDTAELQLKQDHVVTLESKDANMEGNGEVTIRDLVKNALRMRPDRIVVGECRGVETLDMLQAMNTGHDGSMTTAHANSPIDMVKRLETMVMTGIEMPVSAIRNQVVAAVNIVVQLNRLSDGSRKVTHISEVTEVDRDTGEVIVEDIFVYQQKIEGGYHTYTGYIPTFLAPMVKKGLVDLDTFF